MDDSHFERLSAMDLSFLAMEDGRSHMHIGAVSVYDADHPYIHHFPDGNAGVARALVKALVPDVGPGNDAEDLVLSRFDYSRLDRPL